MRALRYSTSRIVFWILGGPGFLLTMGLSGCGPVNKYQAPPPPDVTVATPVQQAVTEYFEFTGTAQPVETVEIRARVKGFLKERNFVEGAEVKQGDLLFVIDEEPFQILLESAESQLAVAKANLRKAVESKSREVAKAQVALSQSKLDLAIEEERRVTSLQSRNVTTQSDIDNATAERKTREAEVQSAKANLEQAVASYDTDIQALRAQVASSEIAIRNARLDLSYCRMYAPIDGRISQTEYDPGNLVGDGQATVLATIMKVAPIYAYFNVSEDDFVRARNIFQKVNGETHVPVELGLATEDGFPYSGRVDYTDPGVDQGTGTLQTRAILENSQRQILPGMFVRVRIPIGERPDALLVPERALGTDQSGQFLLVVGAENKVEYRPVKTGVAVNGMRVVEGKIGLHDQVIVEGLLRARPGTPVTPQGPLKPEPATAATASTAPLSH